MATTGKKSTISTASFEFTVGEGFRLADPGAYDALVLGFADIGVQPGFQDGPPARQVVVFFELLDATAEGEPISPRPVLSERYNPFASGPKAKISGLLRALLGASPKPGERIRPADWIGRPVSVLVEHKERGDGSAWARVANVVTSRLKQVPELEAAPIMYPGLTPLEALPEWVQNAAANQLREVVKEKAPPKPPRAKAARGMARLRQAAFPQEAFPPEAGDLSDVPM
jgi:hypothetical protein